MQYSELQMSAIREIANVGTGSAATSLGSLVGRAIDLDVPNAEFVRIGELAERIGPVEDSCFGVFLTVFGDVPAAVLLVLSDEAAATLCGALGCDPHDAMGVSALQEIGNILAASYTAAIGQMTGLALEPGPPVISYDMLGSIVSTAVVMTVQAADEALYMETSVSVEGEPCAFTFLFLPEAATVDRLLQGLGVA
jgi:chemotaxis protein CheC